MFKCSRHTSPDMLLLKYCFVKSTQSLYIISKISTSNIFWSKYFESQHSANRCPVIPTLSVSAPPVIPVAAVVPPVATVFVPVVPPAVRPPVPVIPCGASAVTPKPPVQVEDGEICKCFRFKVNLYDKEHKQKWNWNPLSFSTTPANLIDC